MIDLIEREIMAVLRRRARSDLLVFAKLVDPAYTTPPHIVRMARALERLEAGKIRRLAISIPPGFGKSHLCSQIFPAWCVGRDPSTRVIGASYSADSAGENTGGGRKIIQSEEFEAIFPEARLDPLGQDKRSRIDMIGGGYYMGLGVGGGWGGKRYRIGIGDDLLKGILAAESRAEVEKVWNWFRSDFMTREEMGDQSKVLLVGTRWNRFDPIGRVMDEQPGVWEYIHIPAIENEHEVGERSLCEAMHSLAKLRQQRAILHPRIWSGVYQQIPKARGGNMFKMNVKRVPLSAFPTGRYVRTWDVASSEAERATDDPDYTVGTLGRIHHIDDPATRAKIPQLWIRDCKIMREEAPKRNAIIVSTAEADGPGVRVAVEAFAAYKDAAALVRQVLLGRAIVVDLRPPGDKVAKAAPLEPMFEAGNVFVPEGAPWVPKWMEQFEDFPKGRHDDCVDGSSLIWWEQDTAKPGLLLAGRR
jgi:predicted phage terminase large subunit-like protein